jgi:hypothetical protein
VVLRRERSAAGGSDGADLSLSLSFYIGSISFSSSTAAMQNPNLFYFTFYKNHDSI